MFLANRRLINSDPYDFYATESDVVVRGTIPFPVVWPTLPTPSSVVNVTNNAELSAALSVSDATINVAAGTYSGAFTLGAGSNQRWILDNAADITYTTDSFMENADRISVEGGIIRRARTGSTRIGGTWNDVFLKNIYFEGGNFEVGNGVNPWNRFAMIHCTNDMYITGLFTPGAIALTNSAEGSHLIMAANYIRGGMDPADSGNEAGIRIQAVYGHTIMVDNVARCGVDGDGIKHCYRSHFGNENVWYRNNRSEYGDNITWQPRNAQPTLEPEYSLGDHWCYDHRFYVPSNNPGADPAVSCNDRTTSGWHGSLTTDGNESFDYRYSGSGEDNITSSRWRWGSEIVANGDSHGTNERFEYVSTPALSTHPTADGLTAGADHGP